MKNKFRIILVLVSVLLFFLILRKINFEELGRIFKHVDLLTYLIGFILIFLSQFLIAFRWKMTLPKIKDLKYTSMFNQILTSYLFNNFFLSIFGGDIYKASRIYKITGKFNAIASILYNRIINIYAAALFPLLVLPFVFTKIDDNSFLFWSVLFSIGCFILFLLFFMIKKTILSYLEKKSEYFKIINEINVANTMWISLLIQLINITAHFLFAVSLGLDIDFYSIAILYSISAVIISAPISINGIGVREGVFIFAFGFWGISQESALAFSFLSFMSAINLSLIGGIILFFENIYKAKNGK